MFDFSRPNNEQRAAVLANPLKEVGFTPEQIDSIVDQTEGFTYSDLTQRLLPTIVLDAYPDTPITFERTLKIAKGIVPTPAFQEKK